ncbi:glycosyltransferase family 25 protein [Rhodovulum strictum]|uniref:Glycosyl transferase family 25 n=1 Tax=Rhodovulum strictum TaxID=58314 RepID=A0A844B2K6_9RHOB|nr:glycosyltransferase family 25 protein [Rhodovulum strictum]MRH20606.1 glycosyl transferase family 25 [Rhodovulum strictum]
MRALVINLACETGRLAFQREQAARLGLDLEVVPAVTVADLSARSEDLSWERWQRPLRDVEKATLLSHRAAWRRVIALGVPVLILEDDAWLMPGAARLAAQAAGLTGVEHLSLETRGRKKLIGAPHPKLAGIRRLWLDRTGAAAYLLRPEGACKLITRSQAVPALADAVLVETPGLRRWQAAPAQAIQIDMAARYGLAPPIDVASAISSVARPSRGTIYHRMRRLAWQVRMGLAMSRPGTERIELYPAIAG